MGATDIRLELSFRSHPKTKKLVRRLGSDGALSLVWLWMFAAESRPDGDLAGMDAEEISLAACWDGEPRQFVSALVECRFLEGQDGDYSIHDWQEHQPWAAHAGERSERARKAAQARWGSKGSLPEACGEHASRMRDASFSNAPSPSPTPTPEDLGEASPPPVGQLADGGGQDALFSDVPAGSEKTQAVPHQAIIDLYHEILPELPPVKVWNNERQGFLRGRWREDRQRQDLAWWRAFFQSVRECPHLMGRNDRNWTPTLEWLVRPTNMPKVLEGYYRRRAGPTAMLSRAGQESAMNMAQVLQQRAAKRERDGRTGTG